MEAIFMIIGLGIIIGIYRAALFTPRKFDEEIVIENAILAALADGKVWVAHTLAAKLGVSTMTVIVFAKQLADNGEIVVSDVKIQGKRKVKGYALPTLTLNVKRENYIA